MTRVERVPEPRWIASVAAEPERKGAESATGGQLEWSYATPWVFRALASPATGERMPAAPEAGGSPSAARAYWSALLSLLIYSLGWARPDRGVRWWYDAGKPTEDARLKLVSDIWGADGQLDWFAAWLWTSPVVAPIEVLHALTGYSDTAPRIDVNPDWLAGQLSAVQSA